MVRIRFPPAESRANSGTDLEGRRVTPMRPMADSRRGAVAGQLRREPWRTNAETVAIITAGIGGIYLRPNWASRGGEMARGQGFVKVQSSQITWFSLPAAQADRVAGLRETCRKPRWKGRERRQEKGRRRSGIGFGMQFGAIEKRPAFEQYWRRISARPLPSSPV